MCNPLDPEIRDPIMDALMLSKELVDALKRDNDSLRKQLAQAQSYSYGYAQNWGSALTGGTSGYVFSTSPTLTGTLTPYGNALQNAQAAQNNAALQAKVGQAQAYASAASQAANTPVVTQTGSLYETAVHALLGY